MVCATTQKTLLISTADLLISPTFSLSRRRSMSVSASRCSRISPRPPDLIAWVNREGGFVHPKLSISEVSAEGMTLVTSEEIPKGSRLIALPERLSLRIRQEDAAYRLDSTLSELGRRVPEELWAMKLGLKLLQERAKTASFWWPYIANLPETFNIPIFFSGEDIKNLQYAPLVHQVNKRCRFLLGFEKEVKSVLEDLSPEVHPFCGQDVNASSLGWAMSAVSSRAFRTDVPMLLPLIDMCNHSFDPNALIIQEKNKQPFLVEVVSGTTIQSDTAITLNYGNLSNDLFLLDYGFIVSSSPHDHVELAYDGGLLDAAATAAGVSSPGFSSPNEWQKEILSHLHLYGDAASLKVNLGGEEKVDGRLLAALRVVLCKDPSAAQKSTLTLLKSMSTDAPLGIRVEIGVLRTIIALCVICLQHFPTAIMDDESILKKDISESTRLSVQFRLQKKLMIVDLMQELTRRVKVLISEEAYES